MSFRSVFCTALLAVMFILYTDARAQEPVKPRTSPLEMVTFPWEDTYIKITYSQPHKEGRNIFGELVPYGKIWRTGANEATEITTTRDIKLAGHEVPAGTYSIFTIPQKDKWTVILNKSLGLWGAFNYNEKNDLLRFDVPTHQLDTTYEPFTIKFDQYKNDVVLKMMWDRTGIEMPVEFE
ncbi:DUF2911 domain-containing protein [Nafulsella turpanensis]|uniref:DUF2911 domain-containing protein n=1 Tax=Nafulsella turpanensis TaxID=1265690 RepID=UPI000369CB22|nr:DUF2911 domain-containing protein [Nafulsella turpanensis]